MFRRWYERGTGRYIRPDPFRLPGGANHYLYGPNSYLYAEGNPIVLFDPLGLYGTNDCSYYEGRCRECGGDYYCKTAPVACENFPKYPDPDPNEEWDFEGWSRCTRKCLQDCDADGFEERKKCGDPCKNWREDGVPDPTTDDFFDKSHTRCHSRCYVFCHFWGTWGQV